MKNKGAIAVFARHRLLANLLMVLIFGIGAMALTRMNIQFFPNFALDVISVRVVWSGASAEDVENGILIPFEERLKTVDGLKRMSSTASQGIASLTLELTEGTDPLLALDQVRQRVDEFRNLPKDAETPQISRISRYESVARLLVSGPSLQDLRPWVRQFERGALARGIDRVDISGLPEERIAIEVPGRVLETLDLSLDGIGEQVGRLAQDLPSGVAGEADGAREIRGLEQRRDPVAFEDLNIVSDGRGLVRLGDVATILREARPAALTMTEAETDSVSSQGAATVELLIQRAETGTFPARRSGLRAVAAGHPSDPAAQHSPGSVRRGLAAHPRPHRSLDFQRHPGLRARAGAAVRLFARAGCPVGGHGHPHRLSRGAWGSCGCSAAPLT